MIILDENKGPPWISVDWWWGEWDLIFYGWRVEYDYEDIYYFKSPQRLRKMGLLFFGPLVITYGSGASILVKES